MRQGLAWARTPSKNVCSLEKMAKTAKVLSHVSGKYVLRWSSLEEVETKAEERNSISPAARLIPSSTPQMLMASESSKAGKVRKTGVRKKRMRCKGCDNCLKDDCRLCIFCKDMTKYGGPNKLRQRCVQVRLEVTFITTVRKILILWLEL